MQYERDCRVRSGQWPDYVVVIDGQRTAQNTPITRASMSFWGICSADIIPPDGMRLEFGLDGEPVFEEEGAQSD